MQGLSNEHVFKSRFGLFDCDDAYVGLKNTNLITDAHPIIFDKLASDRIISLHKEIKTEVLSIQSEIGGIRREILLMRSDIAKADILKWSIVLIVAAMSLVGLLIIA